MNKKCIHIAEFIYLDCEESLELLGVLMFSWYQW